MHKQSNPFKKFLWSNASCLRWGGKGCCRVPSIFNKKEGVRTKPRKSPKVLKVEYLKNDLRSTI